MNEAMMIAGMALVTFSIRYVMFVWLDAYAFLCG